MTHQAIPDHVLVQDIMRNSPEITLKTHQHRPHNKEQYIKNLNPATFSPAMTPASSREKMVAETPPQSCGPLSAEGKFSAGGNLLRRMLG